MQNCIITTTTTTLAMKGQRLLGAKGIPTRVSRLPNSLTASGCAWGITIDCAHARQAKQILDEAGFTYGKIAHADGTPVSWDASPISPVTGTPRTSIYRGGKPR